MSKAHVFLASSVMVFVAACSSRHSDSGRNRAYQAPHSGEIRAADDGITGVAAREVIRRQGQIRRADEAALEANRSSAQGDHEAAIRSYRQALDTLPSDN